MHKAVNLYDTNQFTRHWHTSVSEGWIETRMEVRQQRTVLSSFFKKKRFIKIIIDKHRYKSSIRSEPNSKMRYARLKIFQFLTGAMFNSFYTVACIYIERRSRNSHTDPCNGVGSHGALNGGISVFADPTRRNKHKQNASARCTAFHPCLSSPSNRSTYAPEESFLFWYWENP